MNISVYHSFIICILLLLFYFNNSWIFYLIYLFLHWNLFTVPPRIEPFSFPANIQSGARVHVTCVVSQGDIPVKITWLKDGRPLKPREATTHQIDEYDLALRIQSASPIHDGNYTCVASNDAAKVTHTAPLLVHGTIGENKPYPLIQLLLNNKNI